MEIRAISFDVFDTLVDLSFKELPQMLLAGRNLPITTGLLYEIVRDEGRININFFLDTLQVIDQEHQKIRNVYGREVSTTDRFRTLTNRLGITRDDIVEKLRFQHLELIKAQVRVPKHHASLLSELTSNKIPMGACSNFTDSSCVIQVLSKSDLATHLNPIVVSEGIGYRKPRREIFRAVLNMLGSKPENTLHVGDNLYADIAGAHELGMRTVWITRRVKNPKETLASYRGPAPDHTVSDLRELLSLLDRKDT